jgi:phosphoenolpyruvate carboxylase
MGELAQLALKRYRDLIQTPRFMDYFAAATPFSEIARLNLGSRPPSRRPSQRLEDLRAIPWVFSWSQSRAMLPGWYGFGGAVSEWLQSGRGSLEELRAMHAAWPFFRAMLSNLDMVLAKTDLGIAGRYAGLVEDRVLGNSISRGSRASGTRRANSSSRSPARASSSPTIRRSRARSATASPTSTRSTTSRSSSLRRYRAGDQDARTVRAIHLTINGIAAGAAETAG